MRRREHQRIVEVLERENRRLREDARELRDRLMYALDKPWTLPPTEVPVREPEREPALVDSPEQLPDY